MAREKNSIQVHKLAAVPEGANIKVNILNYLEKKLLKED